MGSIGISSIQVEQSDFLLGLDANTFEQRLVANISERIWNIFAREASGGAFIDIDSYAHYICSSSLDMVSSGAWFRPQQVCKGVKKNCGLPSSFFNAMQCASWGFAVRQHLVHKPHIENLLVSIVDANPMGIKFWTDNPSWGSSGFRVTHIHLKFPQGAKHSDLIAIGKCNPEAMFYDYAAAIYKEAEQSSDCRLVTPYFSEKMRKGLARVLMNYPHVPDQFERYGHLYGADPWLSIVDDYSVRKVSSEKYLVSSIASEGYYCFLKAHTHEHSIRTHTQS